MDTVAPVQYAIPDEQLRWQPPECFICEQPRFEFIEMGWGSIYNGKRICGECQGKYLDAAIAAAKALSGK